MRFRYVLPLLAMMIAPTAAADKTKAVTLTVERAIDLHCALSPVRGPDRQPVCLNVETYDDIIKEGDREKVVARRYQFKPGVVSAMTKNILALRYVVEKFQREQTFLQEKLFAGLPSPGEAAPQVERDAASAARGAALTEFNKQRSLLLGASVDFNLYTLTDADLGLPDGKNPMPGSLLATLDPIRE